MNKAKARKLEKKLETLDQQRENLIQELGVIYCPWTIGITLQRKHFAGERFRVVAISGGAITNRSTGGKCAGFCVQLKRRGENALWVVGDAALRYYCKADPPKPRRLPKKVRFVVQVDTPRKQIG